MMILSMYGQRNKINLRLPSLKQRNLSEDFPILTEKAPFK